MQILNDSLKKRDISEQEFYELLAEMLTYWCEREENQNNETLNLLADDIYKHAYRFYIYQVKH